MKQPSEVPNEITTIKPETTSISEVANPQPSTEPSTVNIESTAQLTKSDHSLNSSTVQQRRQQRRQKQEISNHVESNQISKDVAEEMSKLLIENKKNINRHSALNLENSAISKMAKNQFLHKKKV